MVVDFSKTAEGGVKMTSGTSSIYLGNPENVLITSKDAPRQVLPVVKEPQVFITWGNETNFFKYFLDEFTIEGVAPTDVEVAKADLAEIFSGTV
jgi:hypothetical protein